MKNERNFGTKGYRRPGAGGSHRTGATGDRGVAVIALGRKSVLDSAAPPAGRGRNIRGTGSAACPNDETLARALSLLTRLLHVENSGTVVPQAASESLLEFVSYLTTVNGICAE